MSNICPWLFKSIAVDIEVTQYIDGDLVIDYNEEAAVMIRKSAESLPEIENVSTLSARNKYMWIRNKV